jgi:hypothetical protein
MPRQKSLFKVTGKRKRTTTTKMAKKRRKQRSGNSKPWQRLCFLATAPRWQFFFEKAGGGAGCGRVSGSGILFPHMKHLLFTLHLVYEECKLYRSLSSSDGGGGGGRRKFCERFVQILNLVANKLGLSLYKN